MPDPRPKTLSENPSSRVISRPAKLMLMRSRNAMMYSKNRNGSKCRLMRRRVRSATGADSRAGVIQWKGQDIRALLPAAAQCAIQLNHRLQFHQPQLRQRELAGEQVALGIQHL